MTTGNLGREYNSDEIPVEDEFAIIPIGTIVELIMEKSEVKPTKTLADDGEPMGRYIAAEFVIVSGQYENRRLFENINFENRNPELTAKGRPKGEVTEAMGARFLSMLSKATGVLKFSDSGDFHGVPCMAEIGIEPARGSFPARNKIIKFTAKEAQKVTPTTKAGAAPWAKK